jgi:hypothetical protein
MRSGCDPINPLRIIRLRERGLTYRKIGILIAKEDGRSVPYLSETVYRAASDYRKGIRDADGEREFKPATNKRAFVSKNCTPSVARLLGLKAP